MLLREYLKKNKLRAKDFAKMLGTGDSYAQHIVSGIKKVGTQRAKEIERMTKGAVNRLELLYPEEYENQPKEIVNFNFTNCKKVDFFEEIKDLMRYKR